MPAVALYRRKSQGPSTKLSHRACHPVQEVCKREASISVLEESMWENIAVATTESSTKNLRQVPCSVSKFPFQRSPT